MMKEKAGWDDGGQVLVQVALGLVVLLLVVGLAIDGGNVYGERRAMQNAADAGALAGARAICEGLNESEARDWAEDYAQRNGADLDLMDEDDVLVDMGEGTVSVTARMGAKTFLMRLAGFDTVDVAAEAEAVCAFGDEIGGLWPIAFDVATWADMFAECPEDIDPGDEGEDRYGPQFMVWVDDNIDQDVDELCGPADCVDDPEGDLCGLCDCEDTPMEAYGGAPFGPGDRGWVRLQNPPYPYPNYQNADNCGASALNTWLEHGYTGPIAIGENCVATQPGVTSSGLKVVEDREGDEVNIILYDTGPCEPEDVVNYPDDCPGDLLRVRGFGCIRIDEVHTHFTLEDYCIDIEDEDGNIIDEVCADCPVKNEKVIYVTLVCGKCEWSPSGSAGDGISGFGVPAVSLTK